MKQALKHMLMDLLTLLVTHQVTQRVAQAAPRVLHGVFMRARDRVVAWRPDASFAAWPKQREW